MHPDFQTNSQIKRLLHEEQEYFLSLVRRADIIEKTASNTYQKTLEKLIDTRRKLINQINEHNYLAPIELKLPSEEQMDDIPSKTHLTHALIIIDAKIMDLLQMYPLSTQMI